MGELERIGLVHRDVAVSPHFSVTLSNYVYHMHPYDTMASFGMHSVMCTIILDMGVSHPHSYFHLKFRVAMFWSLLISVAKSLILVMLVKSTRIKFVCLFVCIFVLNAVYHEMVSIFHFFESYVLYTRSFHVVECGLLDHI